MIYLPLLFIVSLAFAFNGRECWRKQLDGPLPTGFEGFIYLTGSTASFVSSTGACSAMASKEETELFIMRI